MMVAEEGQAMTMIGISFKREGQFFYWGMWEEKLYVYEL